MKKIASALLALVMIAGIIPLNVSAARESGYTRFCATCQATGDLDGNHSLEPADAMDLLACVLFPERYTMVEHEGHTSKDCATCTAAGDMDKNGTMDVDDVLYLLYNSLFHGDGQYALDGCTCKDAFFVGYARTDITPEGEMEIYGSTASSAAQNGEDILQMTCTAMDDGENTALLFSLDLRSFSVDFSKQMTDVIEKKFNIPADQVVLNITHTHSTPTITNGTAAGKAWRQKILTQLPIVVQAALDDMDEVEVAYVGTGYTEGITFVRRYLMPDGTYDTNPASGTATAHETEADNEMRTLRIDRKNKKDILMVNYQTHYGSATSLYKGYYSADFVHTFRKEAEAKWDCHFVYHSGASGNLNFMSAIPGERKYSTYEIATREGFIPTVQGCMDTEKKAELGKLRFASKWVEGPVYQDTAEDIANAKIVNSSGYETDSAEYKALAAQYGFAGYRQVQGIITRSKLGDTLDVPFYAISFGDIGFVTAPYEMFDTNGMQVREGSPFEMTFVCSYSNGGFGYVPSSIAFPHGAYEVFISRFCETTGDDFAQEMVKLLKDCKNQG